MLHADPFGPPLFAISYLPTHLQGWYWHRASDPGSRARATYGDGPEQFDVKGDQATDLFLIQMGGNDHRHPNEIPGRNYYHGYIELIDDLHKTHPHATVLLVVRCTFFET
jgi:hypothetical protein